MMYRPSVPELLKPGQSYYSLVIGVAKRAREIAQAADENGDILIEKPVKLAVDDFAKGKCKLVESEEIGVIYDRRLSHANSMELDED